MAETYLLEPVAFIGDQGDIDIVLDDHDEYPVGIRFLGHGSIHVLRMYLSPDAADRLYRKLGAYCEDLSRLADARYTLPAPDLAQLHREMDDAIG